MAAGGKATFSYEYCVAGTEIGDHEKALYGSDSTGMLRMFIIRKS